jgi:hypothetical protein
VDGYEAQQERLSRRTRLEAGLAVLPTAVAAATWLAIAAPFIGGDYGVFVVLIAIPFFATTRRAFVRQCLIIAGLFVPLSIFGVFFGLFLFFPSAVVLLAAAGLAARRPRARAAARTITWLLASSVLAAFGVALHGHFFPPSDIIIVQESGPAWARLNSLSDAVFKAGFTSAAVGTWTSRQLSVDVPASMPDRTRQRLLTLVRAQPGVVTAYWCQGTQCDL